MFCCVDTDCAGFEAGGEVEAGGPTRAEAAEENDPDCLSAGQPQGSMDSAKNCGSILWTSQQGLSPHTSVSFQDNLSRLSYHRVSKHDLTSSFSPTCI